MPREIPDVPNGWKKPALDAGRSFDIKLITPMVGGGATSGVVDLDFPIRPTAIRGQLQFWWRATRGRRFADPKALWLREEEIFGSTRFPSPARVNVAIDPKTPPQYVDPSNVDQAKYALFALQPGDRLLCEGLKFSLTVTGLSVQQLARQRCALNEQLAKAKQPLLPAEVKDITDDLRDAVWAWVNFGGLGSRTRRGCGSIFCKEFASKDAADLAANWKQYMPELFQTREWPTMAESILVKDETNDAISAWDQVINVFRDFRQGVGLGRNPGQQQNRPGRSRFPEPETIRRVTNRCSSQHTRLPHIPDDAFPRAEFGLPIVFHFKDARAGDPLDTVLYPPNDSDGKPRERMASPLILKPLALANGKAVPLIVRLKTPDLAGVDLRQKLQGQEQSVPLPSPTQIRGASLATYTDSPLAGSPNGSALQAFLAYARSEGFTEVPQ